MSMADVLRPGFPGAENSEMAWATFRTLRAKQRTVDAGFKDRRSRIGYRTDGSEFWDLCGVDMGIQRNRVILRDRLRCQKCGKALTLEECELDHIRSRGKGGDDSLGNLQVLCRKCHRDKHVSVRWTAQEKVSA